MIFDSCFKYGWKLKLSLMAQKQYWTQHFHSSLDNVSKTNFARTDIDLPNDTMTIDTCSRKTQTICKICVPKYFWCWVCMVDLLCWKPIFVKPNHGFITLWLRWGLTKNLSINIKTILTSPTNTTDHTKPTKFHPIIPHNFLLQIFKINFKQSY